MWNIHNNNEVNEPQKENNPCKEQDMKMSELAKFMKERNHAVPDEFTDDPVKSAMYYIEALEYNSMQKYKALAEAHRDAYRMVGMDEYESILK